MIPENEKGGLDREPLKRSDQVGGRRHRIMLPDCGPWNGHADSRAGYRIALNVNAVESLLARRLTLAI
jgi:hypothetical protein